MHKTILAVAILLLVSLDESGQAFLGTWQCKVSPVTKKPTFTLNLSIQGKSVGGSVIFVNPDKSQTEETIHDGSVTGQVLNFQTGSGEGLFLWTLKLTGKRRAHLVLVDHRHTKWGPNTSELLVEEELTKTK